MSGDFRRSEEPGKKNLSGGDRVNYIGGGLPDKVIKGWSTESVYF